MIERINHNDFFKHVIEGDITLSNARDAGVYASWKVGGQDFYVYGKRNKRSCHESEQTNSV